ncbi:M28 family peptidase [uncultured Draconibacterium sp.]|uniref:M28 family peptidase n=1 Tax=uncultured Draconibacterium sp. TaxID=1573823 RepID=UPI0032601237
MKKKVLFLLINLLFSGALWAQADFDYNAFHNISSNELLEFASELSSEKYKGRLSGSPEYLDAANWCASKLEEWGIQPANNGSYLQYFSNEYTAVKTLGSVVYFNGEDKTYLEFPGDYFPGSNSAGGTVQAEMVYVGYGITAPELGYDDYASVDVKGKIIILESGTPYTKNDTTLAKWTPYAYHRYKFKNAVKHGAAGMLYTSKLANPNTVNLDGFIYAHIDTKIVEQIFADAGKDLSQVRRQLRNKEMPSFNLPAQQEVFIRAETEYFPKAKACNVVGWIEGSDPVLKEEVLIIGGHLDGQGSMGDVVFPGALDNASGVSNIFGVAKALSTSAVKPRRSILFILLGGEECGLYGSKFYTQNPLFPIEKTRLMINLDMVGNGTGFFVSGGKTNTVLFQHFETANNTYIHREMGASETRKNYGRPRSDASIFETAGIKTLGLWTRNSVHPVYYHHPMDKTNVLTPEIMEDAAKLLYLGILGVANDIKL